MGTDKRNVVSVFENIHSNCIFPAPFSRDVFSHRSFGDVMSRTGFIRDSAFHDYFSQQRHLFETANYIRAVSSQTRWLDANFSRQNFVSPSPYTIPAPDRKEIFRRRALGLLFAAEHGWFIQKNLPISAINKIGRYAEDGDIQSLDALMLEFTRCNLKEIISDLINLYPERADIFREALLLHEECRYLAAIPLFLSQAEGIGQTKSNCSVFNVKRGNKTHISDYLDKTYTADIISMFVAPLKTKHPLTQGGVKRLSRHKVMHGNDTDYGTEFNSLQAISFLGNVGWLLSNNASQN